MQTKHTQHLPRGFNSYLVNVNTMRKIFSNFVCFSENPNFLSFCKHLIQPMTAQRWSVFPVMYCYWLKYMLKKYYVQQKKLPVISSAKKCGRSKDDSDITRFQGIDFTIQLEVVNIWTLAWAGLGLGKV